MYRDVQIADAVSIHHQLIHPTLRLTHTNVFPVSHTFTDVMSERKLLNVKQTKDGKLFPQIRLFIPV